MRRLLFLIILITIGNVSYAAFPVVNNTHAEVVNEVNVKESTIASDSPVFAILSIICSIIALLMLPNLLAEQLYLFFIFSIAALVFGLLGWDRKLKSLARIGSILSLVGIIIVSLILLFIVALGVYLFG